MEDMELRDTVVYFVAGVSAEYPFSFALATKYSTWNTLNRRVFLMGQVAGSRSLPLVAIKCENS